MDNDEESPKNKRIIYIILLGLIFAFTLVAVAAYFIRKREYEKILEEEKRRREIEERRALEDQLRRDTDIDVSNIKSDKEFINMASKCQKSEKTYYINVDTKKGTCGTIGFDIYFEQEERTILFAIIPNKPIDKVDDIKRQNLTVRLFAENERRQVYLETINTSNSDKEKTYIEDGRQVLNLICNNKGDMANLYIPFRRCLFSDKDFFDLEKRRGSDSYINIFVVKFGKNDIYLTTTLYLTIKEKDKESKEFFYLPNHLRPNVFPGRFLNYYRTNIDYIFKKNERKVRRNTIQNEKGELVNIYPHKIYKNIMDWDGKKFDFIYV